MRTLADPNLRTDYLSRLVVPKGRLIVDRYLPVFEPSLHVPYDDGSIVPSTKIGDDWFDTDSDNHWLWGDSDVVTSSGSYLGILRVVAPYLETSDPDQLYKSWFTPASPSWGFTTLAAFPSSRVLHRYCRPGIRNRDDGTVYIWFMHDGTNGYSKRVCRVSYNPATDTFGTLTESTYEIASGLRSIALHPVGDSECVVVALVDNQVRVSYIMNPGVSGTNFTLALGHSADYPDDMAVWSDAEPQPGASEYVIVLLNMTRWPIAKTCRVWRSGDQAVIGLPRMAVPADPDWGNIRIKPISLSTINGHLEAVLYREPVDSAGSYIDVHTILASSKAGYGWHEDVLVTRSTCRGKFLYAGSGQYGYVVGNATVARCTAGAQQGSNYSGVTAVCSPITALGVSHDGPGSAPSITATIPDPDDSIAATGLLRAGNRVRAYLGDNRLTEGGWGLIHTGEITEITRAAGPASRVYSLTALGMSQRVFGDNSYQPASSINLLAPRTEQSAFQFEGGEERLTVIPKTGTWEVTENEDAGEAGLLLNCEGGGVALFAEQLDEPQFTMRVRLRWRVAWKGLFCVFWYQDPANWYRAGVTQNYPGENDCLIIQHSIGTVDEDGEVLTQTISDLASTPLAALPVEAEWFTLWVLATANAVAAYYDLGGSYDYFLADGSVAYTAETTALTAPVPYSLGLEVLEMEADELDYHMGSVTDADADWLEDTAYTWTDQRADSHIYCKDRYHKIQSYDAETHRFTLEDYWAEVPEAGETYYIVEGKYVVGPCAESYSAFLSEMIRPLSAETIGSWVLDACGVGRDWGTAATLPEFDTSGSAVYMRDVEITFSATPSSLPEVAIWGTAQRKSASPDEDAVALRIKLGTGAARVDYRKVSSDTDSAWVSSLPYPAGVTLSNSTTYQFRIQGSKDGVAISVGDRMLASFPLGLMASPFIANEGWCGYLGTNPQATYREFPAVCDVTWDTAETASSFVGRVFQGFNLRPIERADGSIRLGRQYAPLGDLGEWEATVTRIDAQRDRARTALLELAGAEGLTFYLNESLARDGLSYQRQDNPNLWSIPGLEAEAKRLSERTEEQLSQNRFTLHAPDPAAELDDRVEVDGEHYRIESVRMTLQRARDQLQFSATFRARLEDLDHFTAGHWGTSVWGQFSWST